MGDPLAESFERGAMVWTREPGVGEEHPGVRVLLEPVVPSRMATVIAERDAGHSRPSSIPTSRSSLRQFRGTGSLGREANHRALPFVLYTKKGSAKKPTKTVGARSRVPTGMRIQSASLTSEPGITGCL